MSKNFFRHWHYGIKARVVDGALVADIDTAIEPMLVRLELSRLTAVGFEVQIKNNVYELMLIGVGAPAATTALARFEVREAADEACACLKRALLCGTRKCKFWNAFKSTLGVLVAIAFVILLAGLSGGLSSGSMHAMKSDVAGVTAGLGGSGDELAAPAPREAGVPQSADAFLNGK